MNKDEQSYWDEVSRLLTASEQPVIEYRLHYNEFGNIYLCSMTSHPDNTNYVTVEKEIYDRYFEYQVVNGVLKKIEHDSGYRVQLKKQKTGIPVIQNHAGVVIEPDENYEDIIEYYQIL